MFIVIFVGEEKAEIIKIQINFGISYFRLLLRYYHKQY